MSDAHILLGTREICRFAAGARCGFGSGGPVRTVPPDSTRTRPPRFSGRWRGRPDCSRSPATLVATGWSRLSAAGQVLRPNDSRRNQPFVFLRGDRSLHLQQRTPNNDGPDEGPNDSSPPRRSALRDPKASVKKFEADDRSTLETDACQPRRELQASAICGVLGPRRPTGTGLPVSGCI